MKIAVNSENRYIQILEIIYAIIFACAIAKMLDKIPNPEYLLNLPLKNWTAIIISIFVLIRFFFAPSANIGRLVRKAEKTESKLQQISIVFLDVLILLAHSFIFYLMCLEVFSADLIIFYRWFFILLGLNVLWLFSIWMRVLGEPKIGHIIIWCINNTIFVIAYAVTFHIFEMHSWELWFFFASSNTVADLLLTYWAYLSAN